MFASDVKIISISSKENTNSPKSLLKNNSKITQPPPQYVTQQHKYINSNSTQNGIASGVGNNARRKNNYVGVNRKKNYNNHHQNINNNNSLVKNQNICLTNKNTTTLTSSSATTTSTGTPTININLHYNNNKIYNSNSSITANGCTTNSNNNNNNHLDKNFNKYLPTPLLIRQNQQLKLAQNSNCCSSSCSNTCTNKSHQGAKTTAPSLKNSIQVGSSLVMNSRNSDQNLNTPKTTSESNPGEGSGNLSSAITPAVCGKSSTTINSTPITTITPSISRTTNSAPASPGPYTLDFLHQVGVQMTAGAVSHHHQHSQYRNFSPTISPSRHHQHQQQHHTAFNLPIRHQQHNRGYYSNIHHQNQENSPMLINDGSGNGGGGNGSSSKNQSFEIPILYHHPFARTSIINSPIGSVSAENFSAFHHYHQSPASYNNYLNQYNHQQYQQFSGRSNSSTPSHLHSNNNQQQQSKKTWIPWKPKNHNSSHYHHHHHHQNNQQKSSDNHHHSNCSSSSSSSSSSCSSAQTLLRSSKNHQNYRTLTYVSTEGGGCGSNANSRSPTPSPKSESPTATGYNNNNKRLLQYQQQHATSSSSIHQNVDHPHQQQYSLIEGSQVYGGYDSDSSHSSHHTAGKVGTMLADLSGNSVGNIGNGGVGEITSLLNFPTYSDEDLPSSSSNQQIHYYGSQQNLSYWSHQQPSHLQVNFGSAACGSSSPHNIYSNTNNGGSDTINTNHGLNEILLKRGSYNYRGTFRGRRNIYPNIRTNFSTSENNYLSSTPPDRFLARAHLIEVRETNKALLNGSKWDVLSQNIWNKFISCQQTEETYKKKMLLWKYLYLIIKKSYPRFGLYLVGSTISGFGADTSDVDMCLVSRNVSNIEPRVEALFNLTLLKDCLYAIGEFENFHLIEAKVPILRFRDKHHLFEVDLNFNNCVGIKNTHLLYCYSQLDWRLRPLVLITKLWAQFHDINNAKNMTISSYSLVLMVIHFLQYAISPPVLPCLHEMFPEKFQLILKSNDFGYVDMNECIGPYESENTQSLGELFLNFLEYYSHFDYTQYAISIRTGSLLPIEVCRQAKTIKNDVHQWKELCIEEPFDLTNTARSVYDGETFERIKAVFVTSWKILDETLDLSSILNPMLKIPSDLNSNNSSTTTITSLTSSKIPKILTSAGSGKVTEDAPTTTMS